jgi:hypothetical protein
MRERLVATLVLAAAVASGACGREYEGGGDLRAKKVVLQREVAGLRESLARIESGEPLLPPDDVAIAIESSLIRDLLDAQLPVDAEVKGYHLNLASAEVEFKESPLIRLRGSLYPVDNPGLFAEATALGALADITIDAGSSTLKARLALDHLAIQKAAGLEGMLSKTALDEVAREIRISAATKIPALRIPVKVQQKVEIPRLTLGPIRIDAASLPLQAAVSQVMTGTDRLWISIRFQPGEFVKTPAPRAAKAPAAPRKKAVTP